MNLDLIYFLNDFNNFNIVKIFKFISIIIVNNIKYN